jgi:anti-sigma factor RsiW
MRIPPDRFVRDHRWAPDRMSDYLDGALGAGARARMDRHLGECAECRRLLAGLRRTVAELHRLATRGEEVDAVRIATSVRVRLSEPG